MKYLWLKIKRFIFRSRYIKQPGEVIPTADNINEWFTKNLYVVGKHGDEVVEITIRDIWKNTDGSFDLRYSEVKNFSRSYGETHTYYTSDKFFTDLSSAMDYLRKMKAEYINSAMKKLEDELNKIKEG
jgi:hypothetical protein